MNGLQIGAGWLLWMAWIAPPVVAFAVFASLFRWRRERVAGPGSLPEIDPRRLRFEQAAGRPRKRRMAVLESPLARRLPMNLLQTLGEAVRADPGKTRPGLTDRWKGEHRIAIHRH